MNEVPLYAVTSSRKRISAVERIRTCKIVKVRFWPEPDSGLGFQVKLLNTFSAVFLRSEAEGGVEGRGTTSAADAQGTPTQSHISPRIPVYAGENTDSGSLGNSWGGGSVIKS